MTQAQPSFSRSVPHRSAGMTEQNTSRLTVKHNSSNQPDVDSSIGAHTTFEARKIPPLMKDIAIPVYPMLAKALGINEAIVIQQIYYHMSLKASSNTSNHFYEGRWWVYNSYQQWCDNHFPWLTPRSLQNIMIALEKKGILLTMQSLGNRWDRRKWYSLDLKVLEALLPNASMHHTKSAPSKIQILHDESTKSTTENQNTNASRSEDLEQEIHTASPNGESRKDLINDQLSKDIPQRKNQEGQQPERKTLESVLVEDNDSSQLRSLRNQHESLPQPSPVHPPLAEPLSPSLVARSSSERSPVSASMNLPPLSKPVLNDLRSMPTTARSVSESQPKPAVNSSTPMLQKHSPMQKVVEYVLKVHEGYAGKIGQFFKGTIPRSRKDLWACHQPEVPATPQEVLALLLWYREHPAYAVSFTEHGSKLPSTPSILRDRLDQFRDSPEHGKMLERAQPVLERLLRGETIQLAPRDSRPTGPIESAAAYITYDPRKDPAYQKRGELVSREMVEQLLGVQKKDQA